jgi:hypothetical protein
MVPHDAEVPFRLGKYGPIIAGAFPRTAHHFPPHAGRPFA